MQSAPIPLNPMHRISRVRQDQINRLSDNSYAHEGAVPCRVEFVVISAAMRSRLPSLNIRSLLPAVGRQAVCRFRRIPLCCWRLSLLCIRRMVKVPLPAVAGFENLSIDYVSGVSIVNGLMSETNEDKLDSTGVNLFNLL